MSQFENTICMSHQSTLSYFEDPQPGDIGYLMLVRVLEDWDRIKHIQHRINKRKNAKKRYEKRLKSFNKGRQYKTDDEILVANKIKKENKNDIKK